MCVWATADLVTEAAASQLFDGLVLLGDNVYPNGDPERLDATVFEPFATILDQGTSLLPVRGNHDIQDGHAAGQVDTLGMPGRWYSTQIGPMLLIALDSNLFGSLSSSVIRRAGAAGEAQRSLANAGQHGIIAIKHLVVGHARMLSAFGERGVREDWLNEDLEPDHRVLHSALECLAIARLQADALVTIDPDLPAKADNLVALAPIHALLLVE